jgi:methionine-rich copper-binding protein CopC
VHTTPRLLLTLALLTLAAAAAGGAAGASARHLRLVKSEPTDSAVVATPPKELKLWFSEVPALSVTRVSLTRGRDTVALGRLTRAAAAGSPIVAGMTGAVPAGSYTVGWRTMGNDGHVISGSFGFKVAAPGTAGGAR